MPAARAIVTDIEGTTSSIDFVREVLFPYARQHLPAFVRAHADEPEVRHWLDETAKEARLPADDETALVEQLLRWIDADRKSTALKALQGMIWKHGYAAGDYRAHVYPEVPARLRHWHAAGMRLFVYSSGSVPAQQLFFRHSEAGDLSPLFAGYFDTQTGPKREAASYARIATAIGEPPDAILFLSDIVEELDAARAAGLRTGWLQRMPLDSPRRDHPSYPDFDAIVP